MTSLAVERQRRSSFEDSDTYHDGSSVAMLLTDMSNNEKSTNSHLTPGSGLPFGPSATTRTGGRRPSTAPNSGSAPYHLPTSLARSPGETAENSSLRVHEYPPDAKTLLQDAWESSETTNWRAGRGAGTAGSHPYATAQSPHGEEYSSPFDSGDIIAMMAESGSSRSRAVAGGGRGAAGRHPYADPLNAATDAGPMVGDSDEEEEAEDGRRRVVEPPSLYGDVAGSNRRMRRGGGSG
jgi:hypothetical protein